MKLLERKLIQQRGNWRAVLPHALANRLARRALQYITPKKINAVLFKKENQRLFKSMAHKVISVFKNSEEAIKEIFRNKIISEQSFETV